MSQTLTCPVPESIDPFSPNGFQLTIAKLPGLSYFAQEVEIPSVTIGVLNERTPLSTMHFPSTQLEFSLLTVEFLIDSKMDNYAGVLGWMIGLGFPESWEQYTAFQAASATTGLASRRTEDYSAGTLIALNSANGPAREIEFIDMFPVSVGALKFATNNTGVKYLTCKVNFAYDYFKLS